MTNELTKVNGIGKSLAEKMKESGIDSIEKLASMNLNDLLKINGIGKSSGLKYIESANQLLESKQEHKVKKEPDKKVKQKKEKISDKKDISDKKPIPEKPVISKESEPVKQNLARTKIASGSKPINQQGSIGSIPEKIKSSNSGTFKKQKSSKKKSQKGKIQQKGDKLPIKTFFPEEIIQRIRFLHFTIKHIEEALEKEHEDFKLDDLGYVLDYVRILNVNYKTQSQIKIFKELEITPNFYDPLEKREIKIWDLMFECTRVLWVLARAYAQLSEKLEAEGQMKNAIIAMVECSKIYKTATYFSSACTRQEDMGTSLSAENLEFNSEEARIFAQNLSAIREENKENLFLASQMYAGLSALSKRFYFLKEHDKTKEQHLKAQFNYDMGKACYLKAKALSKSSIALENEEIIRKLKQKSTYYFSNAEEIWENMLKKPKNLSKAELDNLRVNLSVVNENIIENDTELLTYEDIKNIQNPEPYIAVPENLGLFLPRSTMYLMKYRPRDLNFGRFKEYKISKLELGNRQSKIEKLLNKKAGIGRTIKQLKFLYDKNDIDINIFFELLEKYEIKLQMIETSLVKLRKIDKPSETDKKKAKEKRARI
ncbi:MAG: helix-hairpin-helix domain-containing protein [Promethearchaeota archaeon]